MTVSITRLPGLEVYDLIFAEHLAMLSSIDQETMHRTMENSTRCWVGMDGDQVVAIWGIIPPTFLSDRAYLWLWTTKHLSGHIFQLIRHSQRAVQSILTEYPTLIGHGRLGDSRSLRWLRWLGAVFSEPQGQFIPFEIKASQWQQPSVQSA